jgi:isocitrate dehydrogenase
MASTLTLPNGEVEAGLGNTAITVAHGDGIGPEIMKATLRILEAAGAKLDIEEIEIGESVYRRGHTSGIESQSWDSLRRTGVFLKAPITTPQGGGFKSLNVTIRKTLGLYGNIRPCVAYFPYVQTRHPKMDLVIVRENEEDLYAGIEHRQTDEVYQCLKLITRPGCEKIVRFAFEYARRNGRKKVTCFTKDNIMKLTDGLFHKVFDEIAAEYPEIVNEHMIVDIGAARLANNPERFDVIVTANLYGDILSDVAAEIAGSVGLAGSANIGDSIAMFEAIHGSAPDIAGRNIANPSGLLQAAVMMLVHIGQTEVASKVQNALLKTIEDGIHTADVVDASEAGKRAVGTTEFADEVIARLGRLPQHLKPAQFPTQDKPPVIKVERRAPAKKEIVGVDVFVHWIGGPVDDLAQKLIPAQQGALQLKMITNRGVKVWPQGFPETFCTDHWRCRFQTADGSTVTHRDVANLLVRLCDTTVDVIKTENLCTFDGEAGYSLGQGQ